MDDRCIECGGEDPISWLCDECEDYYLDPETWSIAFDPGNGDSIVFGRAHSGDKAEDIAHTAAQAGDIAYIFHGYTPIVVMKPVITVKIVTYKEDQS